MTSTTLQRIGKQTNFLPLSHSIYSQDDVVPLRREYVSVRLDVEMLAHHLLRGQAGIHLYRVHVGVGRRCLPRESGYTELPNSTPLVLPQIVLVHWLFDKWANRDYRRVGQRHLLQSIL